MALVPGASLDEACPCNIVFVDAVVCHSLNLAVMLHLISRAVVPVPSADLNKHVGYSAAFSKLHINLDCICICKYKNLIL